MTTPLDLKSAYSPHWCPGCGNYGLLNSMKQAMSQAGIEPHRTVVVSGIGCSGKDPHFLKTYGFEGLHGRVLPVATAVKLANHSLTVIGCSGDGDAYGIGAAHFVHACRRNIGITYFIHNNQIYGLTTGQTSPTSDKGFASKSTPHGVIEEPFNPLAIALASGATFVARTFVGEFDHIKQVMAQALKHKGFALVDIFQPCVTFNPKNTYEWFQKKVYKINDDPSYNTADKGAAFHLVTARQEKLPIGVFYQESRPTYEDEVTQIQSKPLVEQALEPINISRLFSDFI